jgi:hypothetical protein
MAALSHMPHLHHAMAMLSHCTYLLLVHRAGQAVVCILMLLLLPFHIRFSIIRVLQPPSAQKQRDHARALLPVPAQIVLNVLMLWQHHDAAIQALSIVSLTVTICSLLCSLASWLLGCGPVQIKGTAADSSLDCGTDCKHNLTVCEQPQPLPELITHEKGSCEV